MYKELLEEIAAHFSQEPYVQEFSDAREDYFSEAGKAFEDEADYEMKIAAFLEWYLLDRLLNKERETPAEHFLKQGKAKESQLGLLNSLILSQRSLFNVKNLKKYILEDLLYQEGLSYTLSAECMEHKVLLGLEKNQVLDARMYMHQEQVFLTDTYWAHSKDASVCIKKEFKNNHHLIRKNISTVLDFAFMAHRSRQFSHVDLKDIYSLEGVKLLRSQRNQKK